MKHAIDSWRGRTVLTVGHVAGMVDMIALPIWVGTLVQHYHFDPQQAGGLVTVFLIAVVLTSGLLAPRFAQLPARWMSAGGYSIAAVAMLGAMNAQGFMPLAVLHGIGGLGLGCGLSFIHGAIGQSSNPHRGFAIAQFAAAAFAVVFLSMAPIVIAVTGGHALFGLFAAVMFVAVCAAGISFPAPTPASASAITPSGAAVSPAVWYAIGGVSLQGLNQAMLLSFAERIGIDRQFGVDHVNAALIVIGVSALFPSVIAAALQSAWTPRVVGMVAPIVQAVLAITVTRTEHFLVFAVAVCGYVFCTLFTHTFLFGLIARLDTTGRAVASTPAMLMVGAALGPILGGTLVVSMGYQALGVAVAAFALLASVLVSGTWERGVRRIPEPSMPEA